MDAKAKQFFFDLLESPGVSGYEERVQQTVREYVSGFADSVTTDLHGNLIVVHNPDASVRLMLAGHADQIGLLVSYIDDHGFVYTQTVGGWDPQQLVGQRVTIWGRRGPIDGVISRKPIHLLDEGERKQVVKPRDLWIDIGADNKTETEDHVQVGDPVTLALGCRELLNHRICGPGMDDRCGVWVVIEALRRATQMGGISCGLFAVSTVQEEIGLRGAKTAAYGIDPQLGIAVDVTHATDCPTIDSRQRGEIALGDGPVIVRGPNINRRLADRLATLADQSDIPVQTAALARAAPNDSNPLQVTRSGVATGLLAIPNRYMHSAVETVSLNDLDWAAALLARLAATIESADEFIP